MVTITEKRSQRDQLAGFLTIVFALAAWRGWANARVLAIVFAVLAVAAAVMWVAWRRLPLSQVTITADAIEWSRHGAAPVTFHRAAGEVELYQRVTHQGPSPWTLRPKGGAGTTSVDLFGYDVFALQRAAAEHGWDIGY